MSSALSNTIVSSKIDILTDQRNKLAKQAKQLQTMVEEIHEVLQLATSWLRNADGTNNFTFTDINKMIEDKLVFLSITDFSVDCESVTDHQHESTTISLQPASSSTDQSDPARTGQVSGISCNGPASTSTDQSVPARTGQVSALPDELKTIMNQVKVMQDAMSFLSTSSEKLSEKQLTMEKCLESLSDKRSTNQHQKIREIEAELKHIRDKQKKTSSHQETLRKDFELKIQSFEKKENLRLKEELSQQFMLDVNDVLKNIHELNERITFLENQTAINTQLEALKKNVTFMEASSDNLSGKFKEHVLSFEEFTARIDETITNMSSGHGREFEKLQKFKEKIAALEISWIKTSQETKKSYQGVETKYEMVCQVLAERLLPLERLRDIFNEKLDVRTENIRKVPQMNTVCDQMAVLQPKLSQLEPQTQRQVIGFSAYRKLFTSHPKTDTVITGFSFISSNNGNHFDPKTGVFTAPLDGLYAALLYFCFERDGWILVTIRKQLCRCNDKTMCNECGVARISGNIKHDTQGSTFAVTYMKAGEILYVECINSEKISIDCKLRLSCFKIN